MQVALNIILFFLGFSLATIVALRPAKARRDVEKFTSNLRHVTDGVKKGLSGHERGDVEVSRSKENIVHREEAGKLLTKLASLTHSVFDRN